MSTVDHRERLVRIGNDLLTAEYALALLQREGRAIVDRGRSGGITTDEAKNVLPIVMKLIPAEEAVSTLRAEYVMLRELLEDLLDRSGS